MHAQGGLPLPGIVHVQQPYWFGEGGEMSPEDFVRTVLVETLAAEEVVVGEDFRYGRAREKRSYNFHTYLRNFQKNIG